MILSLGFGRRKSAGTTEPGYRNRNGQTVIRDTGFPGNDHIQRTYELECGTCGHRYCANGSDIFQRRCPNCDGGRPGLEFDTDLPKPAGTPYSGGRNNDGIGYRNVSGWKTRGCHTGHTLLAGAPGPGRVLLQKLPASPGNPPSALPIGETRRSTTRAGRACHSTPVPPNHFAKAWPDPGERSNRHSQCRKGR